MDCYIAKAVLKSYEVSTGHRTRIAYHSTPTISPDPHRLL